MSIGGRLLCSMQFADDVDLVGGTEELEQLAERRKAEENSCWLRRVVSSDSSKILVSIIKPKQSTNIHMNG